MHKNIFQRLLTRGIVRTENYIGHDKNDKNDKNDNGALQHARCHSTVNYREYGALCEPMI